MAFWGDYFVYDGIPCTEFGLRLYEVDGVASGNASFSLPSNVSEDRIAGKYKPFFYGVTQNDPLKFKMIFGIDKALAASSEFLDSWDKEIISSWLSPLDGYRWLEIEQPDMEHVRYRCRIENLTSIELSNIPIAFSCEVYCDSPFAYLYPITYKYNCSGDTQVLLRSRSSYRGNYKPKLKITLNGSNTIQIVNLSNKGKAFELKELPQDYFMTIDVDNENGIITNNMDLNIYPYFNFEFFELVNGDNKIRIIGNCILEMTCEYPVSIGG